MAYHTVSKTLRILSILIAAAIFTSCTDINQAEEEGIKMWLNMTPTDSLNQLIFTDIDFGDVKYGKIYTDSIQVYNISNSETIEIYNMSSTNPSQLFTYTFSEGLPFLLMPNESARTNGKIKVQFYAQSLYFKEYRDTLLLNYNPNYRIIIRANVNSF